MAKKTKKLQRIDKSNRKTKPPVKLPKKILKALLKLVKTEIIGVFNNSKKLITKLNQKYKELKGFYRYVILQKKISELERSNKELMKKILKKQRRDKVHNKNDDLPHKQQINPSNHNSRDLLKLTRALNKELDSPSRRIRLSQERPLMKNNGQRPRFSR
ncbi:hypothetical protein V1387_18025 [Allomuricauda taeanensis]|uniref:hypothetical protein n=1 Tax=Flagellimonas taeanensis TaxID=1005926 RepID=UPI002E7AFC5F|nr:hypothetical protein [Allomuricauda taeanensis]MEE1964591.1 hypothetical protein [Allomuricauda taeanensis]